MRVTRERISNSNQRLSSRQQNMIRTTATNVQEFNLADAIFVINGKLSKGGTDMPSDANEFPAFNGKDGEKVDALENYFKTLTQAINQHAVMLNKMSVKQKDYVEEQELIGCLDKVEGAISLYDSEFLRKLEIDDASRYDEDTDSKVTNATHRACNKVMQLGHACYYLYNRNLENKEEVRKLREDLESKLAKKLKKETFIKEVDQLKIFFNDNVDKLLRDMQNKLETTKMTMLKKQGEIDRKMREMEKKHAWKMNEVEVLLDSRSSKQYVDDALGDLEARLNRVFNDETSKLSLSLTNIERKYNNDLGQMRDEIYNKLLNTEKILKKLREDMSDKMSSETFEDARKSLEQKIVQFSNRIRENKIRFDPLLNEMHEMRRLKDQFLDHEERYMEFQGSTQAKLSYALQEIEDLKNMPPPVVEQKIELPHIPQIDENDFEDMKFNVKQLRNENNQLNDTIHKLKDILADKVDTIIFDKNMEKKIDRDDVYLLMEKFSMEDDRIKKVQQDISTLIKRMDYIGDKMDKKIIRLKKELDLTSIQKLLKSKADDTEVKKEFENVDFKVKCMNDTMNGVKKDLDGMFSSLRKISDIISILQQEQATALASTKNAMCLSCGRGDANFLPPMQQVRGYDGNYYRTNAKDNRRAGNVKGKEGYQYGFDVFTSKQIVEDHDKISHDPSDKFYLGKAARPRSSANGRTQKRNLPSIQESEKN